MFDRSLSHFSEIATELQRYLNLRISEKYGDAILKLSSCNVANSILKTHKADEFRKFGLSKEKRQNPIVQLY